VRIVTILREGLEMCERAPVLHDRRETHLVAEEYFLRVLAEEVEHVLYSATPTEIARRPERPEWTIDTGADQEHHEVTLDFGRPSPLC
jgi:hypothetical protein